MALNAKTFGDLRPVMADLPESGAGFPGGFGATPTRTRQLQPRLAAYPVRYRRGPRLLPLVALALLLTALVPGARWLVLGFVQAMLVVGLAVFVAVVVGLARFRRRMRREWWAGYNRHWHGDWRPGGCAHQRH